MLTRKLFLALSILAVTASLMTPIKKAEAGLLIPAGGLTGGLMLLAGGAMMLPAGMMISEDPSDGFPIALLSLGVALIVLDEEAKVNENFNTIPSYLLQEIQDQSTIKADFFKSNPDGVKEIVFTHAEVDEIFELADETTSQDQLESLREILTTRFL